MIRSISMQGRLLRALLIADGNDRLRPGEDATPLLKALAAAFRRSVKQRDRAEKRARVRSTKTTARERES
jgi:hypothetical protein